MVPCDPTSLTNSSALVCDLGTVRANSVTQRKNPGTNYTEIFDVSKLYDYYELRLQTIQVYIAENNGGTGPLTFATKEQMEKAPGKFAAQHKYVRDLSLQLRLYNCLEPLHPTFPVMKLGAILNRVDVVLTDYNAVYVLRIIGSMQKEQRMLTQKTVAMKQAAAEKLIKEHGGIEEAAKVAAEIVKEKAQPEAKLEEKKEGVPEVALSPDKKKQEIMVHFDDINIVIGRTLLKGHCDASQEGYAKELKEMNNGEVPYIPDMRAGINGVGMYAYMTNGGGISLKSHVFRMYVRDMQLRKGQVQEKAQTLEEKYGLEKVVAGEFEYILSNPDVEALKDRLVGDNYSPFKHNLMFFQGLEKGDYLEEQKNQIDIFLSGNLKESKLSLAVDINELRINLPYHSLAPPLYLLSEINSAMPAAPVAPPPTKPSIALPEQKKLEMRRTKASYSFNFRVQLKGVELRLPINVYYRN